MPNASARVTIARASGCEAPCSRLVASSSTSRSVWPAVGMHVGERRRADGQRAGLVDDERVDPLRALECGGVLDQDAGPCALAHADHQRGRRRESERARTRDHEHGRRAHQRRRPVAENEAVRGERDDSDREHRRHEARGHLVGEPLHRRLRPLRRRHLAHDRREQRRRADGGRLAAQRARLVDRPGKHRIARGPWRPARSRRSASLRSPPIRRRARDHPRRCCRQRAPGTRRRAARRRSAPPAFARRARATPSPAAAGGDRGSHAPCGRAPAVRGACRGGRA